MMDNIRKRHFAVMEWCFICKRNGENIDHFMLHFELPKSLLTEIFCTFGFEGVLLQCMVEMLSCYRIPFIVIQRHVKWSL